MKRILMATAMMAAVALPATAFAHVSVGVGINLGGPGYYAPPPVVYAQPAPYYYAPPPPVVYAAPPVVYGPPVGYRPYHYRHHRCWWENGYRVCR